MGPGWLLLLAAGLVRGLLFLTGYLQTGRSFPQPLTPEEEAHYLERMRQGDDEARAVLIERNLRLVAHIAKKFDDTGEDADDLIGIGTVGLIKGVDTFDPGKGTRLATYAARCIENEILMHLRATRRSRREVFLQNPVGVDREGNEITLMDMLPADGDGVEETVGRRMLSRRVRQAVKQLGPRERKVLELRFGLDGKNRHTQREVARVLGISRSYVSRIEKRAVRQLTRHVFSDGEKD
ncbi:MAG TPA: RNA polymerase sporulation sigma factor SigK [Thermaerobacter sp.]|nr:MAG: RNA polymerase sporulation sigma factor SigK [Bacillota bacterium]